MIAGVFRKGEIVWVDFGNMRTGSELMGKHWAIVFEINNNIKSDTVVVVPISSCKGKRPYPNEVNLGHAIPGGKISLALIHQLTRISKQRIISKTYFDGNEEICLKISSEQAKDIEKSIMRMMFGQAA